LLCFVLVEEESGNCQIQNGEYREKMDEMEHLAEMRHLVVIVKMEHLARVSNA
jgi:hypothetical protein